MQPHDIKDTNNPGVSSISNDPDALRSSDEAFTLLTGLTGDYDKCNIEDLLEDNASELYVAIDTEYRTYDAQGRAVYGSWADIIDHGRKHDDLPKMAINDVARGYASVVTVYYAVAMKLYRTQYPTQKQVDIAIRLVQQERAACADIERLATLLNEQTKSYNDFIEKHNYVSHMNTLLG